jgi:hypothetical protein
MEFTDRENSQSDDVQGLVQNLSNMKLTEENLIAHTQRAAELSPQPDIAPSPCRIITMSSRGVALTGGDFTPKRFADVENLAVLVTGWPQELSLDEKDALLAPFSAVGSLHSWVPDAPDGEQPWEETALVIFGAHLHATKACSSKKLDSRLTARPVREASPEMLAVLKKMPLSVPAGPKLDSTAAARVISFTLKQRNPAAATAAAERIAAARRVRESAAAAKERPPAAAAVAALAAAVAAAPVAAETAAAASSAEARSEQPAPAEQQQNSSEQPVPVHTAAGDHSYSNDNAKRSSGRGRGRGRRRSTAGVKANSVSASTARDSSAGTAAQRTAPDAASATSAHGTAQRTAPAAACAAAHGTSSETAPDTAPTNNTAVSGADRGRGGRGSGRRRRGRGRVNSSSTASQPQQQQQQQQQQEQQQHEEQHESNAYDPEISWS